MAIDLVAERPMQSRKCTGSSAEATLTSSMRTCQNILIQFRTPNSSNRWLARIVDRHVLRLIKMWLKAPIEERDSDGKRRITGGKRSTCGTPQGGVASPMLANLYMNRFLKHWRLTRRGEAFCAYVVSYADDFVILSRGSAAEALAWTKAVMTKLGLILNEAKTSLKDARTESFDFLGYSFGPHRYRKDGHWSPTIRKARAR